MSKALKIILFSLAGLLALAIGLIASLPVWFDVNDYKSQIIDMVRSGTNREFQIPGQLELSFFPWFGVTTGEMVLLNKSGFDRRPLASIEQSEIKVRLLPLLSNDVQISQIKLIGLKLHLLKNKQGKDNWSDLIQHAAGTAQGQSKFEANAAVKMTDKEAAALAVGIAGIKMEESLIEWDDQVSGKHLILNDLNMNVGAQLSGEPVNFDLAFVAGIGDSVSGHRVRLTSEMTVHDGLNTIVLAKPELTYSKENPDGTPGFSSTINAKQIRFDKNQQSLSSDELKMEAGTLKVAATLSGERLLDQPILRGSIDVDQFNPRLLIKLFQVDVPDGLNKSALTQSALQLQWKASQESIDLLQMAGYLDDTRISGSGVLRDYGREPKISFDLKLDKIDLNRYVPAAQKAGGGIATPAIAIAAALSRIPESSLKPLKINGSVQLQQLRFKEVLVQGVELKLEASDGTIKTRQMVNKAYQGSYQSNTSLAKHNGLITLSGQEKVEHIQLGSLLEAFKGNSRISGVMNASSRWQSQGASSDELRTKMKGQIQFRIKDGVVKGLNLQKFVDQVVNLKVGSLPVIEGAEQQTVFTELSGSAVLQDGIASNRDLVGRSSNFRIDGKGHVNLKNDNLNYRIVTRLIKKTATQNQPEQFHSTPIVINVSGSLHNPRYELDVEALLTEKNKAKIQKLIDKNQDKVDKLLDKLDKKLGPGTRDLLKGFF